MKKKTTYSVWVKRNICNVCETPYKIEYDVCPKCKEGEVKLQTGRFKVIENVPETWWEITRMKFSAKKNYKWEWMPKIIEGETINNSIKEAMIEVIEQIKKENERAVKIKKWKS